jgi:hypothetical protein
MRLEAGSIAIVTLKDTNRMTRDRQTNARELLRVVRIASGAG